MPYSKRRRLLGCASLAVPALDWFLDRLNLTGVEHKELVGIQVPIHLKQALPQQALYATVGQLKLASGTILLRSPTAMVTMYSRFARHQHVICAIVLFEYQWYARLLLIRLHCYSNKKKIYDQLNPRNEDLWDCLNKNWKKCTIYFNIELDQWAAKLIGVVTILSSI